MILLTVLSSRPRVGHLPTTAILAVAVAAHVFAVLMDVSSRMAVADLLVAVPVIISIGWLIQKRRKHEPLHWSSLSGILLAVDFLCVMAGVLLSQYWLVTCGLCFLTLAILHASRDHRGRQSLCLLILPVIPAISLSGPVDDWVKGSTADVAQAVVSRVCHSLSLPHYRDSDSLRLGERQFSLAGRAAGLGSPTAWIALAFLVICLRRVSFVPATLFTLASLSLWGMLTLYRGIVGVWLLTQSIAAPGRDMQFNRVDVLLQVAALAFWISAGHAIFWLTHPIPVSQFAESRSEEFNLLTFFWNRLVGHAPERATGGNHGTAGRGVR